MAARSQRCGQVGRDGGDGGVDFGCGDAEAVGGQGQAVEAGGVVDQGGVAAGADLAMMAATA